LGKTLGQQEQHHVQVDASLGHLSAALGLKDATLDPLAEPLGLNHRA